MSTAAPESPANANNGTISPRSPPNNNDGGPPVTRLQKGNSKTNTQSQSQSSLSSEFSFSKAPVERLESLGDNNVAPGERGKLSATSKQYDVGEKGYLTDAEQQMRDMDQGNHGYLTNAQVAQVVEQTMELRNSNLQLRNWVLGLFGAVVILGLSNLGTAFAAARLAKDTEVDENTGKLQVKGDVSTTVVTQGTGVRITTTLNPNTDGRVGNGEAFMCVNSRILADFINLSIDSTESSIVTELNVGTDDESVSSFSVRRSGIWVNTTHVIVYQDVPEGSGEPDQIIFDMTSPACDDLKKQEQRQLLQQFGGDADDNNDNNEQLSTTTTSPYRDGYWNFYRNLKPHLRPLGFTTLLEEEEQKRHLITVVVDEDANVGLGDDDDSNNANDGGNVGQYASSPTPSPTNPPTGAPV